MLFLQALQIFRVFWDCLCDFSKRRPCYQSAKLLFRRFVHSDEDDNLGSSAGAKPMNEDK